MSKDESSTENDEYWGNIWGWKVSLLGLALILIMLGLMGIRKCQINQAEQETIIKTERIDE